ncbi:MAG: hypothetical protein FD174_2872 [Geobacteraceae bacterium]|nr:MAG: hypothetical protein FD174_2872 [Geobacteraceae bacterium]
MKVFALILVLFSFTACATTATTSFYGTKSAPATVSALVIVVSDKSDNSELRGNEFLMEEIITRVRSALSSIGVKCVSEKDITGPPSHILLLSSGGVEDRSSTHVMPVQTTETYHSGINSQGNVYTYSTPHVSGGGSYSTSTRAVNVEAVLFRLNQDGSLTKVSQSYANGDGYSLIERRLGARLGARGIAVGKPLPDVYVSVFIDAAQSLFEIAP